LDFGPGSPGVGSDALRWCRILFWCWFLDHGVGSGDSGVDSSSSVVSSGSGCPVVLDDAGGYGIGSGGPDIVSVVSGVYSSGSCRSRYDAGGSGLGSLVQVVSNSGLV